MFRRREVKKVKKMVTFGVVEEVEEPPEYIYPFTEEGKALFRRRLYDKCLEYLDKSLEVEPVDPLTLAWRSRCQIHMFNPSAALADARKSKAMYRHYVAEELGGRGGEEVFSLGLLRKADALYHKARFEEALVLYHQGTRLRPGVRDFPRGVARAQQALLNSLGAHTEEHFEEMIGLVPYLAAVSAKVAGRRRVFQAEEFLLAGRRRVRHPDNTLGRTAGHKRFTTRVLAKARLTDDPLKQHVVQLQDFFHRRREFWTRLLPAYARRMLAIKAVASVSREHEEGRRRRRERLTALREELLQLLRRKLRRMQDLLRRERHQEVLPLCEETAAMLQRLRKDLLPERDEILVAVHGHAARASALLGRCEEASESSQRAKEAAEGAAGDLQSVKALTYAAEILMSCGRFVEAALAWRQLLTYVRRLPYITRVTHELGRCHLALRQILTAKMYFEWCLHEAEKFSQRRWAMHAHVRIAETDLRLGDAGGAVAHMERAREMAASTGSAEVERYLEKMQVVVAKGLPGGTGVGDVDTAPATTPGSEGKQEPAKEKTSRK